MSAIPSNGVCNKRIRLQHGTLACNSEPLSASEKSCPHSTLVNGTCILCKIPLPDSYGVAFDYLLPGLRYSKDEISRIKKINTKNLLRKRKLHLVLDLDHTLLHSRRVGNLRPEEQYLKEQIDPLDDISKGNLFKLDGFGFLVKLRPYVRTFLEEASTLFQLYVCTMGSRDYALQVTKLLDPDFKYFESRIISRKDFKQRERKNLDLVLGQESGIVILDDTQSVWTGYTDNLITVGGYHYFKDVNRQDCISYSEEKTDESDSNGALANILKVLKKVHKFFFDNLAFGDVRSVLLQIRMRVLMGCTILLSDVEDDFLLIWSLAEELGAVCTTVIDDSVTHVVVSSNVETKDFLWAKKQKRFLVHPRWIVAAYFLWNRQPEDDYFPSSDQ